jgi:uncharacterized protein YwqG
MSLFSFLSNKNKPKEKSNRSKKSGAKLTDTALQELIDIFTKKTGTPIIRLKEIRKPTSVFDSKFGGTPYLPPCFVYPHNENGDKKPLKLLAQLNFGKLPPLQGFPTEGILQFYIAFEKDEDCYGADFDNPTKQSSFRVVYHKDIVTEENILQSPPELEDCKDSYFPFEGEWALEATKEVSVLTNSDFRYDEAFEKYLKNNPDLKDLFENVKEVTIEEQLNDALYITGHQIGGYPVFTQYDPRDNKKELQKHTILLLQIDSNDNDGIMWGDYGVANFFITPEALKNLDFSEVLYTWDCG